MKNSSVSIQKRRMRLKFRELLSAATVRDQKRESRKITKRLLRDKRFRHARTLFTYIALPGEVQTFEIMKKALRAGKKIAAPKMKRGSSHFEIREVLDAGKGLKKGRYGVLEPGRGKRVKIQELDFIIVPGLAFDKRGNRLGRGLGAFDRFLKKAKGIPTVGLAFKSQIVRRVPREPHDIAVDRVITA